METGDSFCEILQRAICYVGFHSCFWYFKIAFQTLVCESLRILLNSVKCNVLLLMGYFSLDILKGKRVIKILSHCRIQKEEEKSIEQLIIKIYLRF